MNLIREERIDEATDERVAIYRIVRDPELVRTSDAFLAEGRLVVRALIANRPELMQSLLVTPAGKKALGGLESTLPPHVPVYLVEPEVMTAIGGIRFHQGCIAAARRPALPTPMSFFASQPVTRRLVYLDGVGNPDNVGTVIRSALALGATGLIMGPKCASPLYRKALRASMGAALRLPWTVAASHEHAIAALHSANIRLLALTTSDDAVPLDSFAATLATEEKWCLAVGSEHDGLSPAIESAADAKIVIPMHAETDSINLAAAAAIALYRLTQKR